MHYHTLEKQQYRFQTPVQLILEMLEIALRTIQFFATDISSLILVIIKVNVAQTSTNSISFFFLTSILIRSSTIEILHDLRL